MKLEKVVLIIFTVFHSLYAIGQDVLEGHGFVQLRVENGLSNNSVTSIVQDDYGFIWIGTKDGLNLYDGKNFKIYRNNPKDSTSLADNHITALFVDSKNRLWIGYERRGVSIYDRNNDAFRNYQSNEDNGGTIYNYLTANFVTSFTEDLNGSIWIATISGLNKYREDKDNFIRYYNTFEYYSLPKDLKKQIGSDKLPKNILDVILKYEGKDIYVNKLIEEIIKTCGKATFDKYEYTIRNSFARKINIEDQPKNEISYVESDANGNLWLGHKKYGLTYFNPENNTFKEYPNVDFPEIDFSEINSLYVEDSLLWITTNNHKIISFNLNSTAFNYVLENHSFLQINKVVKFSDDVLLFATNEGLVKFNKHTNTFRRNAPVENKIYTLSSKFISEAFVDKNKNIWAGTSDKGLNLSIYNKNFRIIDQLRTPINLYDNRVTAMHEDAEGNLWVGYYIGDIDIIDKDRKSITRLSSVLKNPNDFKITTVFKIFEDSEKNIWIGTYGGGLQKFDRNTKRVIVYKNDPGNPNSISNNDIRDIDEDKDRILWITTHGGGLCRFDKKSGLFKSYRTDYVNWQTGMIHDWLNSTFIDSKGNIWISSVDGISIFNPKLNRFTGFKPIDGDINSISHNTVRQVFEDSKNNIWLATENGLNLFISNDSSFRRIGTTDGLASANINAIEVDDNLNLWLATSKGISKISPYLGDSINLENIKTRITNYDELDGLQGTDFYICSSLKSYNGQLYFGGTNGISYFNPDKIGNNPYKPEVYITGFKLFNEPVIVNKKYDNQVIIDKNIKETKTIHLRYDQNNISFDYIALNYIKSAQNSYAYILEGFDGDWNYVGNKTEVVYTNLNPGQYIFKVKAANNDGIWNEEGAAIEIIIAPPYWQTWWFRTIVVSLIIFLLISFYLIRIRSFKENQKILERKVNERTQEIKQKNEILRQRQQKIEEQANKLAKSNQELIDLNIMKDRLFSIMGHDLKNPLNAILGFSELLNTSFEDLEEENIIEYSAFIHSEANNILDLLNNLLAWARSQSKHSSYEPENTDVYKLVKDNELLLNELIKNKEIKFINQIAPNTNVHANTNMLDTVIRKLLNFAIKNTIQKGEINICSNNYSDRHIQISISNSGEGIPEEKIDDLFALDKNLSEAKVNGEEVSGMDLLLCKDFVTRNNGKIWIENLPGEGSVFHFTLPLVHD